MVTPAALVPLSVAVLPETIFARSACVAQDLAQDVPKRLPNVSHVGYQRYFLTARTASRVAASAAEEVAARAIAQLRHSATAHEFARPVALLHARPRARALLRDVRTG